MPVVVAQKSRTHEIQHLAFMGCFVSAVNVPDRG